ncbi:MAG: hypothetical protein SFX72_07930 [Isosphaeraceae bacterium]|nr:hypothetical protein [Isosphaeraceae bacterium]
MIGSLARQLLTARFGLVMLGCLALCGDLSAQEGATPARWIRHEPGTGEPKGETTRWFRKAFRVKESSTLVVDASAEDRLELRLDGKVIATTDGATSTARHESTIATGEHVLTARVSRAAPGVAAWVARGGILPLGQGVPIHTDRTWRATTRPPEGDGWMLPGFDDRGWPSAEEFVPQAGASDRGDVASRWTPAAGFRVETAAAASVTGSVVAMTFDERGAPCVSVERGPICRLVDVDGDGDYDERKPIAPGVENCQGLAFIKGKLYAVGSGPSGVGIYRLADVDGDGVFEKLELVRGHDARIGEHGPHAIMMGPDGKLYHNVGNHAHLKPPIDRRSPVNVAYEGDLLPHHDDPRGHAQGILAPGGEIYRSDDEGASWTRVSAGYRNHYDFAFNRMGDLFTFDSDMEWDQGLPWYRPIRVVYAPVGSEFGWRGGTANWPNDSFDSLPPILELGRGSPTGVAFYQGSTFPPEYDDALLLCDWSRGRILAVRLKKVGASYSAESHELVTGRPLNCTDIEVGPDGAVWFATGGRNTEGGLYRVVPIAPRKRAVETDRLLEALRIDSPQSSFSRARIDTIRRELGADWNRRLEELAFASSDAPPADRIRALDLLAQFGPEPSTSNLVGLVDSTSDVSVRARALVLLGLRTTDRAAEAAARALADPSPLIRLRACEALIQQLPYKIPGEALVRLLEDPDRFLRSTARTAIEHCDIARVRGRLMFGGPPRTLVECLLALARGSELTAEGQDALLARSIDILEDRKNYGNDEFLDALRVISLAFQLGPVKKGHGAREHFGERLTALFPSEDPRISRELARLIAFCDAPGGVAPIVEKLSTEVDPVAQFHFARCLSAMRTGWTAETKRRLWDWFQTASGRDGGFSYLGYLDLLIQDHLPVLSREEKLARLNEGMKAPYPARILVRSLDVAAEPDWIAVLDRLHAAATSASGADDLSAAIAEAFARAERPEAREALRAVFRRDPGRRDVAARALARGAETADLPVLVEALDTLDPNTASTVVAALSALDAGSDDPAAARRLLLLGRRTGPTFASALDRLAARWIGGDRPAAGASPEAVQDHWEAAYSRKHPGSPLPPRERVLINRHTFDDLLANVVRPGLVASGSPERGRVVLTKARCLECHRFGNEGAGVGPDLTTLSSRFGSREILEAIVDPSKVVSDQYKSITAATEDGRVVTGMPIAGRPDELTLLQPDGSKATIPLARVEERKESRLSVMPEGLLNAFGYQEIGDLLALFQAQPKVEGTGSK